MEGTPFPSTVWMKSRGFSCLAGVFLVSVDGICKMEDPMSIKEALRIAEACQEGRGPDSADVLAEAILRLLQEHQTPERLIGLIGRLYTVAANSAAPQASFYWED